MKKPFRTIIFIMLALMCQVHLAQVEHKVYHKTDADIEDWQFSSRHITSSDGLPSNQVHTIVEDADGYVWIGTNGGLCRYDGYGFINFNGFYKGIGNHADINIASILPDDTNRRVWVRTASNEIFCYDMDMGRFLDHADKKIYDSLNERILANHDDVWIRNPKDGTSAYIDNINGNVIIYQKGKQTKKISLIPSDNNSSVKHKIIGALMPDGRMLFATKGTGLTLVNPQTGKIRHFTRKNSSPLISFDEIYALTVLRNGTIIVGSEGMGIDLIKKIGEIQYDYHLPNKHATDEQTNFVRFLTLDNDGQISFSTRAKEWYKLNSDGSSQLISKTSSTIYCNIIDNNGRKWVGTQANGLFIDAQHYSKEDKQHFLPCNKVYDIKQDKKGRIWIATGGAGLLRAKHTSDGKWHFEPVLKMTGNKAYVMQMALGTDGTMWLATSKGLYQADMKEENITEESFHCYNASNATYPTNALLCIFTSADGRVWAGGQGCGVVVSSVDKFGKLTYKQITTQQGLVNDNVRSVLQDSYGNIWAGTEDGLACIRKGNILYAASYRLSHTLAGNIFSQHAAVSMPDGRLAFGTADGLLCVSPHTINYSSFRNSTLHSPHITDVCVSGISLMEHPDTSVCFQTGSIVLPYNRNDIDISFSNLDYVNTSSALYSYRLEGLDKDWTRAIRDHHATYSNIPPGHYNFCVRTLLQNGQWSEPRTLKIIILQPWWNTWWAWIFYIISGTALCIYIYLQWRRNFDLRQQMKMEKQMTEFRLDFFTHIAHEFRTPLALIQGATDKLLNPETQRIQVAQVKTAQRGTHRLLKLINQLMEFRRINAVGLRLNVEEGDIVSFVRDIYQYFWNAAKQKDQVLTFTPQTMGHTMLFDHHFVETIVYNLLSNAIKYTPEKKHIGINLRFSSDLFTLIVEDSGPGITPEQEDKLFQPFMHGYVSAGGIGIGLYVSYRMAEAHKGSLTYKKGNNGGSVFTLTLPNTDDAYSLEERKSIHYPQNSVLHSNVESFVGTISQELAPPPLNNLTIVIIEDDPDMMQQLRNELAPYFIIKSYMSGDAAIATLTNKDNDWQENIGNISLILCDVMLPDVDGYEVVRRLRRSNTVSHVPIVMLTALNDDSHQIRAYKAGADDFLTKPYNYQILITKIMKLIESTKQNAISAIQPENTAPQNPGLNDNIEKNNLTLRLRAKVGKEGSSDMPLLKSKADEVFIYKVQSIIANRMSDSEFSVDDIADALAMSRSTFYRRMGEVTNSTPNAYLMQQRMRHAAELIKQGNLNIEEVAYKVGINNRSYFYKIFKKTYGVTPAKYCR